MLFCLLVQSIFSFTFLYLSHIHNHGYLISFVFFLKNRWKQEDLIRLLQQTDQSNSFSLRDESKHQHTFTAGIKNVLSGKGSHFKWCQQCQQNIPIDDSNQVFEWLKDYNVCQDYEPEFNFCRARQISKDKLKDDWMADVYLFERHKSKPILKQERFSNPKTKKQTDKETKKVPTFSPRAWKATSLLSDHATLKLEGTILTGILTGSEQRKISLDLDNHFGVFNGHLFYGGSGFSLKSRNITLHYNRLEAECQDLDGFFHPSSISLGHYLRIGNGEFFVMQQSFSNVT